MLVRHPRFTWDGRTIDEVSPSASDQSMVGRVSYIGTHSYQALIQTRKHWRSYMVKSSIYLGLIYFYCNLFFGFLSAKWPQSPVGQSARPFHMCRKVHQILTQSRQMSGQPPQMALSSVFIGRKTSREK